MAAVLDGAMSSADRMIRSASRGGERAIGAGRAHDDGERPAVQADVEQIAAAATSTRRGAARHARHVHGTDRREVVVVRVHGATATVMISIRAPAVASDTRTGVMAGAAPNASRHAGTAARAASSSVT